MKLDSTCAIGQPSFQLLSVSTQHVGRESHVIAVGVAGTRHAHNGTDCPILRHSVFHQVLPYHKLCRVQWTVVCVRSAGSTGPPQNQNGSRRSSVTLIIMWHLRKTGEYRFDSWRKGRDFSVQYRVQTGLWCPPSLLSCCDREFIPLGKVEGSVNLNHSAQSNIEVRNTWSYISTLRAASLNTDTASLFLPLTESKLNFPQTF